MRNFGRIIAVLASLAPLGSAVPVKRAVTTAVQSSNESDTDLSLADSFLLNYALTLEHLEVAFYKTGLGMFDETAFTKAGLPSSTRGRFEQIYSNEVTHERILTETLGKNATQACQYKFSLSDVNSFASTSATLESMMASAYTGIMNLLSLPSHIKQEASILATEARQAAWIMSSALGVNPWNTPFETALTMRQSYSLASSFIASCPETNPIMLLSPFPQLLINSTSYAPGQNVTLWFDRVATGAADTSAEGDSSIYLALLTGSGHMFAQLTSIGQNYWVGELPSPMENRGTAFAVVSRSNSSVADEDVVAGVAAFQFPYNETVVQGL